MNHRTSRNSSGSYRLRLPYFLVVLILSAGLVAGLLAQNGHAQAREDEEHHSAKVAPNWDLAERWTPAKVGKLLFDTSITPHWFELSEKFWYSFQTTDGTHWWVVDPVKKSKSLMFDNAKVAAQLSLLTALPYDSQHLAIRNVKLAKKDTVLTFDVQVSKDAVIPNEEKKAEEKTDETDQEENQTDQTQGGGRGQGGRRGGAAANTPPPETQRTIYFELDIGVRQGNAARQI